MTTSRFVLALVAALSFLTLAPTPAYACSCVAGSTEEYVDRADVVVGGRFVARDEPGRVVSSLDPVTYTVEVDRVYRGAASAELEVLTAVSGASCGLEGIALGRPYLVYATYEGTELWAGLCGGTTAATPGLLREVEAVTGPAQPPAVQTATDPDPDRTAGPALRNSAARSGPAWWPWVLGTGLVVGAAAAARAVRRHRTGRGLADDIVP